MRSQLCRSTGRWWLCQSTGRFGFCRSMSWWCWSGTNRKWVRSLMLPGKLLRQNCYSRYGLPPYAYLIRRTGTFTLLNNNLATPLFSNGTPFVPHTIQTPLFPLITRFYSDIYDAFIISTYDSSLSTNTYTLCPPCRNYAVTLCVTIA